MFKFMKDFKNDESGAVTVDWVVLAGAVVALAVGVVATVETGLGTAATTINTSLGNAVNATGGVDIDNTDGGTGTTTTTPGG